MGVQYIRQRGRSQRKQPRAGEKEGKNPPARLPPTLHRFLQRQHRPIPLELKRRIVVRIKVVHIRGRVSRARRQAPAAFAAGSAGFVDEVERDAVDTVGARAGGVGVEAGDVLLQG